jgi:hypothetical protein
MGFQDGYTYDQKQSPWAPPTFLQNFGQLLLGIDWSDSNGRLFGTHYCGPGGGGSISPGLDAACAAHDACYKDAGLGVWSNWNLNLSSEQQAKLQTCNQNLCNAVRSMKGVPGASSVNVVFTNIWGFDTCR